MVGKVKSTFRKTYKACFLHTIVSKNLAQLWQFYVQRKSWKSIGTLWQASASESDEEIEADADAGYTTNIDRWLRNKGCAYAN
jgi:hypothetical protein